MKVRITLMLDEGDDGETAALPIYGKADTEHEGGLLGTLNAVDCGSIIVPAAELFVPETPAE